MDENTYDRFYCVTDGFFVRPEFDNRNLIHVSTGMSTGNGCLFNWWKLKKWFTDNKIKHNPIGSGCPDLPERACDFICYVTEQDYKQEVDPLRVSELKEWLYNDVANKRITKAATEIGITKDEIKDSISGTNQFSKIIREILGEDECQQK